jgi:hypothetical protein
MDEVQFRHHSRYRRAVNLAWVGLLAYWLAKLLYGFRPDWLHGL